MHRTLFYFYFFIFLFSIVWKKSVFCFRKKRHRSFFLNSNGNSSNKNILKQYISTSPFSSFRKNLNKLKLKDINSINVGELKVGVISDVIDNDIYVKLKNSEHRVLIKRENNYLLENELLYTYLFNSNLISLQMYNKLTKKYEAKENANPNYDSYVRENQKEYADEKEQKEKVDDCIVLIKSVEGNELLGELYTEEIAKRKEIIYEKLNELKTLGKKIFIKVLKNVKNKYYIVLVNDCIQGYLINDDIDIVGKRVMDGVDEIEGIQELEKKKKKKKLVTSRVDKLSAYIVDVNKRLEYVFLSLKKYVPSTLENRLLELQNTIVLENMFQNNYFKGEIVDFSNNGNNIIVKIFDSKTHPIKVKVKSYNLLNTRNLLRNFDYLKHKILTHEFTKLDGQGEDDIRTGSLKKRDDEKRKREGKEEIENWMSDDDYNYISNENESTKENEENEETFENVNRKESDSENERISEKKKNAIREKKEQRERFLKFKASLYGCKEVDAVKYINLENYIYKEEKCIYVRIINKTIEKNFYEGSMKKVEENIDQNIYNIFKKLASEENQINHYDKMLRYPSTVLGTFNNYVLLRTKILEVINPLEIKQENNQMEYTTIEMKEEEKIKENNTDEKITNSVELSRRMSVNETNKTNKTKDVITLIEKCFIDYENLKEGDVFFCRFEKIKNQSIRNLFNLSNDMMRNIYDSYFSKDMKQNRSKYRRDDLEYNQKKDKNREKNRETSEEKDKDKDMEPYSRNTFENIFFKKKKVYIMRGELHKDTEYRLNKNKIDTSFKKLKNICDTYYSGFNKAYDHFPSLREEFISLYLGPEKYKLYRKIIADYFSSNINSYKEFLQSDCKILTRTIFDLVFENPEKITKELIHNYNIDVWNKVKRLNVFELNCLLKDLQNLKKTLYTCPLDMNSQIGRMNLLLNNQKPISKEIINSLKINEDVKKNNDIKKELMKVYKRKIIYPISFVKELLIKKKNAKYGTEGELNTVYILAEESINLYENSAKDVEPFSEEDIEMLKRKVLSSSKGGYMGMQYDDVSEEETEKGKRKEKEENEDEREKQGTTEDKTKDIRFALSDPSNSQIRKVLYMIKDDLEAQKKKNKLDEVDKYYEEEQKQYTDITKVHKNLHELEEMGNLTKDMFYMKIPFIE